MARGRPKKEVKAANGLPHPEVLKTLANQVGAAQADAQEAAGEVGALMKGGEEKHGIDRKAFKLAVQLKKMDSSKLNQFLKHIDHYRVVFELDKLAGADMLDSAPQTSYGDDSSDDDEEDVRPPHLIEQERQRKAEEAAAEGVAALKKGIKGMPGADSAGPSPVH